MPDKPLITEPAPAEAVAGAEPTDDRDPDDTDADPPADAYSSADAHSSADDDSPADEDGSLDVDDGAVLAGAGGPGDRGPAGRGRYGVVALAFAVVVGLLLGYAAGWLVPRLTTPGDDSAEAGFARDMSTHHAQAVEMGLIAWQRASSPIAQRLGVDIATGQQGDIGTMQTWLRQWRLQPTTSRPAMAWMPEGEAALGPDGLMPGMASSAEMTRLRAARGTDLDILFLQLMIRHHLGGIHMVDGVMALTSNAEVLQVARTMKANQQAELSNLQTELTRLGGKPLPAN